MDLILNLMFIFLVANLMQNIKKKMISLLILELIFLVMMIKMSKSFNSCYYSGYTMLVFSIFMVLDSVMGVSILINNSRNSSKNSILASLN